MSNHPLRHNLGDAVFARKKDGRWRLSAANAAPGGYKVMFAEFKDFVIVLEVPLNAAVSQAAVKLIKQTAPDKPIRYIDFLHFHFDYTGGLRHYTA